jgi:hypothetical protein
MRKLDEILQELLKLETPVQKRISYGIGKLKLCIDDLDDIDPRSTDYMGFQDYAFALTHLETTADELPNGDQKTKLKEIVHRLKELKPEIETDRVREFKNRKEKR